jgi:hypothetical protein
MEMNKELSKKTDKYVRKVNRYLKCKKHTKKFLIDHVRFSIEEYFKNHPGCTFGDMTMYMGRPSRLAEQLMDTLDKREVKEASRVKWLILISVLTILVVLFICFLLYIASLKTVVVHESSAIITSRYY